MCKAQCLLVVILFVGMAHSWDLAVSVGDRIEFYNEFGGKIETAYLPSQNLAALVYDEVHNMLLYSDKQYNNDAICGYDMTSKQHKCYVERSGRNIHGLAFDPITETLFFTDLSERSINTFSFKRRSKNNVHGNLLLKLDNGMPTDLAVDSCRGYIYWINKNEPRSTMERARFDGSGRQVIINAKSQEAFSGQNDIHSVALDQQMRKVIWLMPWSRKFSYTFSADLNGQNGKGMIIWSTGRYPLFPNTNAFSKNYLFGVGRSNQPTKWVLKYPKPNLASNVYAKNYNYNLVKIIEVNTAGKIAITANYKMDDQFQGISECSQALNSFCVHGTKVPGRILCKCTPGYTGDRCEVSVCDNYCSNGNCSVTEQGHPTCRCEAGYSGERCEVNVCHDYCSNSGTCSLDNKGQPICQCQGLYMGQRCEIPAGCVNYCFKGNCSFSEQGHPTCRCEAGYSGERCEVNVCNGHCLNSGTCSLDDDSQPICQCQGNYVGQRCEIPAGCVEYCFNGNYSFTEQGHPTCRCEVGYSGERCEVNVCNGHCLNSGTCSLDDDNQPICQCQGNYVGQRCEISSCLNYCFNGNCSVTEQGHPTCRCGTGYSGERCEVKVGHGNCLNGTCTLVDVSQPTCHCQGDQSHRCEISGCLNYCLKGNCSLTEQGHPTCRCDAGYSGERCEVDMCDGYCQNGGTCSLNEEDDPVCECVGEYDGDRCEVPKVQNQPDCQCACSKERSGRKSDKNQTSSTSTLNNLDETEISLTLADLLENWRQRNNIH